MNQDSLWQAVLGEIELSVSRGNFMTWFKRTKVLRQDDDKVVIGVPNVFIKHHLESKYNGLITQTLEKNGVHAKKLEFKIHTDLSPREEEDESTVLANPQTAPRKTASTKSGTQTAQSSSTKTASPLTHAYRQGLNEKYTFENFVVGSGNELAHAACQAVAVQPGTKYNPLFLYGGVGIGKTHLIQAAGNSLLTENPSARVVYVSSEQFLQEFVDALRYKKNTDFADFYRGADMLIIDDIQFIAGKEKVQEEFFHTFNALHQANKQLIISSDQPPKEIPTLEERLRSRFTQGMSIDMQIPDYETRCAIIQTKAEGHEVELPPDVVGFLANLIRTNIRELEGELNRLLAWCEMRGLSPDLQIATSLLGTGKTRPKHINAKQIVERTAKHFRISIDDLMGPKRDRDIVVPRQIAMYLLRSELHLSFPKIATELGRKDHTTALHSVEKISRMSNLDADVKSALDDIKGRLYA